MKVILLQNVTKVGKKGDVVEVSDGYATNALLPNKKAIIANTKNLELHNKKIESIKQSKVLEHKLLESAIKSIPDNSIDILVLSNEKGHLFSSINKEDIVKALSSYRINISESNIKLKEPIKTLGSYAINIQEGDYSTEIKLNIKDKKEAKK